MTERSDRLSRRQVLQGVVAAAGAGFSGAAAAEALTSSPRPVARKAAEPGPKAVPGPQQLIAAAKLTGVLGYAVVDAKTGALLEAMNPGLPLPPASVT